MTREHTTVPVATTRVDDAERAYDVLAAADADLADLVARRGRPDPFDWAVLQDVAGDDPFAGLTLHIVSQQISTAAAVTIFRRVGEATGQDIRPAALATVSPAALRAAGVSGAKARALRDLAERVHDGRVDFARLARSDDDAAQEELERVRGVGPWSAQMFLLHNLRRPDVFPAADVGLLRAAQEAFGLSQRPSPPELAARAEGWRPFRSYAAALLWAPG